MISPLALVSSRFQLGQRLRAARANRDAAVAQQADALLGVVDLVVDQHETDDGLLFGHGLGQWSFVGCFYTLVG